MNVGPVLWRELCGEARRPFTYGLRVVGAGALVLVLVGVFYGAGDAGWTYYGYGVDARRLGQDPFGTLAASLFGRLNAALFTALWLLVPLLTADCLSRERREGTLGLLFLTPLRPLGIVIGKAFVQGLRAWTLYLTMLPLLALPLLLGGVSPKDGLMAVLVNANALVLALAAGLLASALTRDWVRSAGLAVGLSLLFALVFMRVHEAGQQGIAARFPPTPAAAGVFTMPSMTVRIGLVSGPIYGGWQPQGVFGRVLQSWSFNTDSALTVQQWWAAGLGQPSVSMNTGWGQFWSDHPAAAHAAWFALVSRLLLGSLGVLAAVIGVAAWLVAQGWRDAPATAEQARLEDALRKPRFAETLLRRKMTRALDRNPIGWLHQYSYSARLVKWGWALFVVVAEVLLSADLGDLLGGQFWLLLAVVLGLCFSAAGSFRRERETGALELLLVTPLGTRRLIAGRVLGVWMQFLPALALLVPATLYAASLAWFGFGHGRELMLSRMFWLIGVAATAPVIGLYFSLSRLHFLAAWLATVAVALGGPVVGLALLQSPLLLGAYFGGWLEPILMLQAALGAAAFVRLDRQLRRRQFQFLSRA